jgi:TrmH family RNA methyltransferase
VITSTANSHVKYIRSLSADRRERHRERCFVLEGVRLVQAALHTGVPVHLGLYAPEQLAATDAGQHLLGQLADQSGWYAATPRVVAAAADTVTPQGVVAVAAWPDLPPRPGLTLVLDAIQDPGNVGTLLRSAAAVGVGQIVCMQGTADIYSPKVVRAAMGAHFSLPLLVDRQWDDLAGMLAAGTAIYAAVAQAPRPYYAVDWCWPAALIIGNEAQGISDTGLALATTVITIPMEGPVESLNAAIAGSVILFEALRQRTEDRRLRTERGDHEHY